MYIAMNRFRIHAGREADFEKVWRERESFLDEVPGFREFHLLRGATAEGFTTYLSHSVWESGAAFEAWTRRGVPQGARRRARPAGITDGHPLEATGRALTRATARSCRRRR
jgi:heme-degrading monooxygenase HmoA